MDEREVTPEDLTDAVMFSETNLINAVRAFEAQEIGVARSNASLDGLRNEVVRAAREYVRAKDDLARGHVEARH